MLTSRNILKNSTVSTVRKSSSWSRPQIRLQVSYIKFENKNELWSRSNLFEFDFSLMAKTFNS